MNNSNNNSNNIKQFFIKSLIVCLLGGFMYILITNTSYIISVVNKTIIILLPFIYGIILAYLKYPLYNKINNSLKKVNSKYNFKVLSIIITEILVIIVLSAIIVAVLPKFIQSVTDIINSIPNFIDNASLKLTELKLLYPDISKYIDIVSSNVESRLLNNTEEQFVSLISEYITKVTTILKNTGTLILNLILGIVISILLIFHKDKIFNSIDKIVKLVLNNKAYIIVKEEIKIIHNMVSGFFIGKIIDSLIIGVICFIVCKCLNMPYSLVIAVIVGVTNVIPVFGPFIGAIPSIFIVLSVDPIKAIELIVFIFILQQFDGNILGPKLLGNSTGMDTLWIIFAITLFGGLFGIVGMILGVPIVAVIKDIITKLVNYYIDLKNHNKEHIN